MIRKSKQIKKISSPQHFDYIKSKVGKERQKAELERVSKIQAILTKKKNQLKF